MQEFNKQNDHFFCYKRQFKETASCYHLEAKWLNKKYLPGFDEYLGNALPSTGLCMLGIAFFMGMQEEASIDDFEYTLHHPKFVAATTLNGRLIDDIVDHEVRISKWILTIQNLLHLLIQYLSVLQVKSILKYNYFKTKYIHLEINHFLLTVLNP